MRANNPIRFEMLKEVPSPTWKENARENPKEFFRQPTAEELSSVTFAKLPDIRIHTQEQINKFAHLLNRGSSLE